MLVEATPLISPKQLVDLPSIEDVGMLGFEAIAFVRLYLPKTGYSLYVSGSDGKDTLYGLLTTRQTQRLGLFFLSGYEWARRVLEVPIIQDTGFAPTELRPIAYRHYSTVLKALRRHDT